MKNISQKLICLLLAACFAVIPAENIRAEESGNFAVTVTPEDYLTVSNPDTEKLSCAPGLVSFGKGNFAIAYLADDINTVETESSRTIVCRLGIFNISDPENGRFFDIAMSGQTIGDITIGNKAPYEPNLLKTDENNLLVIFNLRDTNGNYVYYGAIFDIAAEKVLSFVPLTLDGKSWMPENIASSYNALADKKISSAGPSGSMVFTSQIIEHGGYFYGFCGGICKGFSGILVRSSDGINWESVMVPESSDEINGIIECGFQILDGTVYFCMRDISSGVYHCSYEFSSKKQLSALSKLPNLTTSKPNVFMKDGEMFLIVNKATGDDSTVGRRNTALFYKVDPKTCNLIPARQVFCRDGCAYHATVRYGEKTYWCFHTDARRINPYTQGRSNIAFMELPEMIYETNSENGGILDLSRYSHMYSSGCIRSAANTWQSVGPNYHYQIPLSDFSNYNKVTITSNSKNKTYIAIFASYMSKEGNIDYAEGWENQVIMEPGTTRSFEIPKNAEYLYILNNNAAGDSLIPEKVVFGNKAENTIADLNLDGKVDVMDVYTARLIAAKLIKPTEEQLFLGDVDSDGKITAMDANIIRKHLAGIINSLPVQ